MRLRMWRKQIICILGGFALYAAASLGTGVGFSGEGPPYLRRNPYGEGEIWYSLSVEGLSREPQLLQVQVEEQKYTEDGAFKAFSDAYHNVERLILNGNSSLNEVRGDLNLVTTIPQTGVRVRWSSDRPEILDSFGTVYAEDLLETGEPVQLTMEMTDGVYTQVRELNVIVLPELLTEEERRLAAFEKKIAGMEESARLEDGITLPEEYEGKKLHYREVGETDYKILLVLGFVLAGLCYAKDIQDKKEQEKKRSRQMLLDYSEIVSKLMVFVGAGMTLSLAWERIVRDYEGARGSGICQKRFAYEEMSDTYYQMKSGVAEGRAFREFGLRCRLQPYRKFASLLEQNRKNGIKNLRNLLQIEMADAFEQRKNTARRLGEEAGTKLLVPLFFMLGIVMVMIVMPAFLSFY